MKVHDIKCWPEYFQAAKAGKKPFEVRKNDRNYQIGDVLQQMEWDPISGEYSGDFITQEITYILHGGQFGIDAGYIVMGLLRMLGVIPPKPKDNDD